MKKIFLSGDHAGFKDKEKIRDWTKLKEFEILDFGPFTYDEKDDYPDFVIPMSRALVKDRAIRGIIIAGSGEGEAIVANKIKGIRAIVYHGKNLKIVKTAREHNNANVLCLGSRFVGESEMKKAIMIFLKTKFDGGALRGGHVGRHERRIKKFERLGGK